jgi:hypothetical protein
VTLLDEVITAPATLLALAVVALGLLAWAFRKPLAGLAEGLSPVGRAAANDFGFEWVNRRVVVWTQDAASALRTTQTGYLNWNVVGIVGGLLLVLVILALGA